VSIVVHLLILNHTTQVKGGAEQFLYQLIQALLARGDEVTFLTEDDGSGPLGQLDLRLIRADTELSSLLRRLGPDAGFVNGLRSAKVESQVINQIPSVLFAHNYYGTCISGEKRHRNPRLTECHRTFGAMCLALYFPRRCGAFSLAAAVGGFAAQNARRHSLDHYRRVLVASNHMQVEFKKHTRVPIDVVPLFVAEPPEPKLVTPAGSSVVFIGRLTAIKGPQELLLSLARVQHQVGPDIEVVFVGDGPSRSALEDFAKRLKLRATFTGWLDPIERDVVLARAAVLVLPSLWPEPFGLVGLEAARLGVPAVAYDFGGVRDWLTHGLNGLLVPVDGDRISRLGEAIVRVLDDQKGARRLASNATLVARGFSRVKHLQLLDRSLALATAASAR
jgi:glycosyltransferase involved in cell wall biosynthesis